MRLHNVKTGGEREGNKAISTLIDRLKYLASNRRIDPPRWIGVDCLLDEVAEGFWTTLSSAPARFER